MKAGDASIKQVVQARAQEHGVGLSWSDSALDGAKQAWIEGNAATVLEHGVKQLVAEQGLGNRGMSAEWITGKLAPRLATGSPGATGWRATLGEGSTLKARLEQEIRSLRPGYLREVLGQRLLAGETDDMILRANLRCPLNQVMDSTFTVPESVEIAMRRQQVTPGDLANRARTELATPLDKLGAGADWVAGSVREQLRLAPAARQHDKFDRAGELAAAGLRGLLHESFLGDKNPRMRLLEDQPTQVRCKSREEAAETVIAYTMAYDPPLAAFLRLAKRLESGSDGGQASLAKALAKLPAALEQVPIGTPHRLAEVSKALEAALFAPATSG
jgi:hypothetical protein